MNTKCFETCRAWTNNGIRAFRVAKAKRLLEAGKSVKEICALMNLSESQVRSLIRPSQKTTEVDMNTNEVNIEE